MSLIDASEMAVLPTLAIAKVYGQETTTEGKSMLFGGWSALKWEKNEDYGKYSLKPNDWGNLWLPDYNNEKFSDKIRSFHTQFYLTEDEYQYDYFTVCLNAGAVGNGDKSISFTLYNNRYKLSTNDVAADGIKLKKYGIEDEASNDLWIDVESYADKWVDLDITVLGKYVVVTFNGRTDIYTIDGELRENWYDFIAFPDAHGIYFSEFSYRDASSLKPIVEAIDNIPETVEVASVDAVKAARELYLGTDIGTRGLVFNADKYTKAIADYKAFGNVNLDKAVDILDLVRLKKILAETAEETFTSDINDDGQIFGDDLVILRKILLGVPV